MNKRIVSVYEYKKSKGADHYDKVFIENGEFHQFGCDYEPLEDGVGNYSTAIIEMPNGIIKNVPVELIVFKS